MIDAAPDRISSHGRVVLQRIRALLAVGRVDAARALLETGIEVPDLREGETLGTLWQAAYGDGHCRTATTSGCVPTSSNELGSLAVSRRLADAFCFVGPHGELDAVSRSELGHQAGDVELDCAHADVKLCADLGVCPSPGKRE